MQMAVHCVHLNYKPELWYNLYFLSQTKHQSASIFHHILGVRSCRSSALYCGFITLFAGSIMNSVPVDSLIPLSSSQSSGFVHLHSFKSNVYRLLLQSSSIRFVLNLTFYFVCKYYAVENNIIIYYWVIVTNILLNGNDGLRWMKRAEVCYSWRFVTVTISGYLCQREAISVGRRATMSSADLFCLLGGVNNILM